MKALGAGVVLLLSRYDAARNARPRNCCEDRSAGDCGFAVSRNPGEPGRGELARSGSVRPAKTRDKSSADSSIFSRH